MEEEARTLLQRSHEVNNRTDWVLIQLENTTNRSDHRLDKTNPSTAVGGI